MRRSWIATGKGIERLALKKQGTTSLFVTDS
jgi:hypothetical protein